jgi:hypothetical protein
MNAVPSYQQQNLMFSHTFPSIFYPSGQHVDRDIVMQVSNLITQRLDNTSISIDGKANIELFGKLLDRGLLWQVSSQSSELVRKGRTHSIANQS